MNEFDIKAREWETNPVHWERSEAVAKAMQEMIPFTDNMKALEYGAGTGILSFLLRDKLSQIIMMDSSREMVKVMREKVSKTKVENLKPKLFNLEQEDYKDQKFDLIFNQMVLHHVNDITSVLRKFYLLLRSGGYLAIADLYPEDGSFHGSDVHVHHGFDVKDLAENLNNLGFKNIDHRQCFVINKQIDEENLKSFPVFLLVASK